MDSWGEDGVLWNAIAAALFVAYLAMPSPEMVVPILALVADVEELWGASGFLRAVEFFRLVVYAFVLLLVWLLVGSWRPGLGRDRKREAVVRAWLVTGYLPAFALPMVVMAGLASESGSGGWALGREWLLVSVQLITAPVLIAAGVAMFRESARRASVASLE